MHRLLLAAILALPLPALAQKDFSQPPQTGRTTAPPSRTQGDNTRFTLLNESDSNIDNLDISPISSRDWGHDLFGTVALPPHSKVIVGPDENQGCLYDVRVRYHDDREEILRRQDLCKLETITFTGRNAHPMAQQK